MKDEVQSECRTLLSWCVRLYTFRDCCPKRRTLRVVLTTMKSSFSSTMDLASLAWWDPMALTREGRGLADISSEMLLNMHASLSKVATPPLPSPPTPSSPPSSSYLRAGGYTRPHCTAELRGMAYLVPLLPRM